MILYKKYWWFLKKIYFYVQENKIEIDSQKNTNKVYEFFVYKNVKSSKFLNEFKETEEKKIYLIKNVS